MRGCQNQKAGTTRFPDGLIIVCERQKSVRLLRCLARTPQRMKLLFTGKEKTGKSRFGRVGSREIG